MIEHTKLQDILTCLVAVVIFICQSLNRLLCWVKNHLKPNKENISSIVTADTTVLPGTISNDGNIASENCIRVQELIQKHFDIPLLSAEQEPKVNDDLLIRDVSAASISTDFHWPKENLNTVEEYIVDDSFVARGLGLIAATVGRQSKFYSKYNDSFDGIVVELKSRKGETGKITILGRRSKASAMEPKSIPIDYVHDDDRIKVTYTPLAEGVHTVTLSKDDLPICRSPYYVSADKSPTDCRSRIRSGGKKYRTVTRSARCKTTETKNDITTPETEQHNTARHDTARHGTAQHKTTSDDTEHTISAEDKYIGMDVRSIVTKFESKTFANGNKCQTRSTCDNYENYPAETEIRSDTNDGCSVKRIFETNKDTSPDKEISENTNISIVTDDSQCLPAGIDTTDIKTVEYYHENSQELTIDQTEENDDLLCGRTNSDDDDDRKTVIVLDNANETDSPDRMSKILKCLCESCCKKVLSILQILPGDVRVTYNNESVDIKNIQKSSFEILPAIRININIENKIQSDANNLCLHNSDCSPGPNENDNTDRTNSINIEKNSLTSDNSGIDETDTDAKHTITNYGIEKQQEPFTINQTESLSAKQYCSENEIQTANAICNLSATEISANDIANTHDDLTDVSNEIENAQEEFTAEKTNIPNITETVTPAIDKLSDQLTPNAVTLETLYLKNETLVNDQNKSDIDTKEVLNHSLSDSTENKVNAKHKTNSDSKINNFENVTLLTIPKNNDNMNIKNNNLTTNTDLANDLVSFIEKSIEPAIHSFKDTIINTILTIFLNNKNDKFYQLEQMADSAKPRCSDEVPFDPIEHTGNKFQTLSTTQNTDFQHFIDIFENALQAKNNNWTQIKIQSKFKSIMDSIMENRTKIIHDRHPVEDIKTENINSEIITDAFEKNVSSNGIAGCEQIIETNENNNKQETVPCGIESDIKEEIAFNHPGSTKESQIEVKIASQIHFDLSKDTVVSLDDKINDSAIDDNKLMTRDIKPNHDKGRIFVENLPPAESFETNELSVKYKIIDDAHTFDENYTCEPSTNHTNMDNLKTTPSDNINSNTDDTKSILQDTQFEVTKHNIINTEQHQTLSNDIRINDKHIFTEERIVDDDLLNEETSTTKSINSENLTKFDLNLSHGNRRFSLQEYLEESSNQFDFNPTNESNINVQFDCDLVNLDTKSNGDSKIVERGNEQLNIHLEINENNVEEVYEDNSIDRIVQVNVENKKLLGKDYSDISNLAKKAINSEVHVLCSHTERSSVTDMSKYSKSTNEETMIIQQNSDFNIFCEQTECSIPNETDGKLEENLQEFKNTSFDLIGNILNKQFPVENVNSISTGTKLDDNFTGTDRAIENIEHESKEGINDDLNEKKPYDRIFETNISEQSNKGRSLNHYTSRETSDDKIQIDLVVDQEISVELPVCKLSDIDKNVQSKEILCEKIESFVARITSSEKIDNVNIPEIVLTHSEEPNTKYTPPKETDEILEMSANNIIEKVEKLYDDISQEKTECGTKVNFELVNDLEREKYFSETFETEETPICDAYLNRELSMDEIKNYQTTNDKKDVSGDEFIENYKQIETFQTGNTKIDEDSTVGKKLNEVIEPIVNVFCVENPQESSVQDFKTKQLLPILGRHQTCDNFDPDDGIIISDEIKNAYSYDQNATCADDIQDETKTNIRSLSKQILNKSFSQNETSVESSIDSLHSTDSNITIEVHNHNARRLSLQEYLEDTLQSFDSTQLISDHLADETNMAIKVSNQDNKFTWSKSNQLNDEENDVSTFNTNVDHTIIENLDFKTSEDPINDNRHLSLQYYLEEPPNPIVTPNVTDVDTKSNYKPLEQSQTISENLTEHNSVVEKLTKSSDITSNQTSDVQLVHGSQVQNSEGNIDTNLPSKRLSNDAMQLDDVESNTKSYIDKTADGQRRLSLQVFLEKSLESISSPLDRSDHKKRSSDVDYDTDVVNKDLNVSIDFGSRDFGPDGSDKPLEKSYGIANFEGHQTCDNFDPDDEIVSSEIKNAYSSDQKVTCVDETKTNCRALSNQILETDGAMQLEDVENNTKLYTDATTDGRRRLSLQEFLEESLESINSTSGVDYDPSDKVSNVSTDFGPRNVQPSGSDRLLEKAYGIRKVEMSVQRVKSSEDEYFEQTEKICLGNDTIEERDQAVVDDRIYTVNESDLNAIICASSLQEALTLLDSKIKLKCKKGVAKCSKRFDNESVDAEQNERFFMTREYFENMKR